MKTKLLATAAALLLTAGAAHAADLGGNCCSDLEERVAELEATAAKKGNRAVSLQVYGEVNMAYLTLGGNGLDYNQIGDNSVSQTRFGFRGSSKIRTGWEAGFVMEFGVGINREVSPLGDSESFFVRESNVYLSTPAGKFTLGRAKDAAYGISEIDMSRASVAARRLSLEPLGGRFASELSPNDLPLDGQRGNIIRYDSPMMAGFTISASWGNDDSYAVALRYAGEVGKEVRVAAGVGFSRESTEIFALDPKSDMYNVGASMMHVSTGLFLGGSYAKFDGDLTFSFSGVPFAVIPDVTLTGWHINGGIERKWFALGSTTLYGEYANFDIDGVDISPVIFGAGIVQHIDMAAMDLYLTYRNIDLDISGIDKVDQMMAGARIRF